MLSSMRKTFGPVMIGIIIGFIAFVFVFYGVYNPKSTRGRHEGAVAGTVNGESISVAEFNRELSRRIEFYKNLAGGKLTDAQLKSFRIHEGVFQELVNRKLMSQAAQKMGMVASDEEIRARIQEMPVFHREGRFDPENYRRVLDANKYTPAAFERMMRDDLTMQQWSSYFRSRAKVSDEEIRREFLVSRDRRNIKYVLITSEVARKGLGLKPEDKIDQKLEEVRKFNEELANKVAAAMTADASSDKAVSAILKPYGAEVKMTGPVSRVTSHLPGIGEARELMADAFATKSPIDPKQGGKAKKYNSSAWWIVAVVKDVEKPDLAKLDAEKTALRNQLLMRKERELYGAMMKKLVSKAKIVKNDAIVGDEEGDEAGG